MILSALSIFATLIFGAIAIVLSFKEGRTKKELLERERKQKQRLYEISILKEIQERIGYELDVEKITDVIIGSLRNFFPYSLASSLFIKNDKLIFKAYLEEEVSHNFVEHVKKGMLASLSQLLEIPLPLKIEETLLGALINDANPNPLSSLFHIPLTTGGLFVGLISVASTKPGLYKEDEMTILYQIANQASSALSKLQNLLETEKGKLAATIASLADGVFMVDTENQLLLINNAAKNLLKVQKESPNIFDIINAFSQKYNLAEKIQETISQNKLIEEKELKIADKTVQIFVTPVVDAKINKVLGASILLHDITLEKQLSSLKEDFTNMMVHELRAPLSAIKGASDLMAATTIDKEEQNKFLNIVSEQSGILLNYVSSLLDAAKIESGSFAVEKTPNDIKRLIEKTVETFLPAAKLKNIEVVALFAEDLPMILYDSSRINQVLNNLLSNSLKFTPSGGKIKIEVLKEADPRFVTVSVSDTGAGIPKEKQAGLFSKFSQAQDLRSEKGTGLGLFIVKGIIEAHGGSVFLTSAVNQGTTVSFTLPASPKLQRGEPVGENKTVSDDLEETPRSPIFGTPLN